MKPKNFIFSTLISATICGSAFALSADDRQTFCESHPDKYVWVEKTQACIPVKLWLSSDQDIRLNYMVYLDIPNNINLLVNRYMDRRGKAVTEIKKLDDTDDAYDYYAVKTTDGDYRVFEFDLRDDDFSPLYNALRTYSRYIEYTEDRFDFGPAHVTEYFGGTMYNSMSASTGSEQECRDAADFASLLADQLVRYEFDGERRFSEGYDCKLMVPSK